MGLSRNVCAIQQNRSREYDVCAVAKILKKMPKCFE